MPSMNKQIRRRQAVKQRRRRPRKNQRSGVLPPAKSIWGHIFRTVVQTAWDIAQGALQLGDGKDNPKDWYNLAINADTLLAQGWFDKFKAMFNELKVNKITAHYVPYASFGAMGEYIFTLSDEGQDGTNLTFASALGSPASVVRKSYQPAKLVWVPTEPEDRNWHPFADGHTFCASTLAAAEKDYNSQPTVPATDTRTYKESANLAGKIVLEVDVSARGKPKTDTHYLSPSTSAEFQAYSEYYRCECRKCSRIRRPAFDYAKFLEDNPQWLQRYLSQQNHVTDMDVNSPQSSYDDLASPRHLSQCEEGGAR